MILCGMKRIEYRSRPTQIVGQRFYIYAAKAGGGWNAGYADCIECGGFVAEDPDSGRSAVIAGEIGKRGAILLASNDKKPRGSRKFLASRQRARFIMRIPR